MSDFSGAGVMRNLLLLGLIIFVVATIFSGRDSPPQSRAFAQTGQPSAMQKQTFMSDKARLKGCWSVNGMDARGKCESAVDGYNHDATLTREEYQEVTRLHDDVVAYARDLGMTEQEFADSVGSGINDIEASAGAAAKTGSSVKSYLDSLRNFSRVLDGETGSIPAYFPRYDAEGTCRRGRQDKSVTNYCIEHEQIGYNTLMAVWDGLSADEKKRCTDLVSAHSYMAYYSSSLCAVTLYNLHIEQVPHHFHE
jgi:hypothetical protein